MRNYTEKEIMSFLQETYKYYSENKNLELDDLKELIKKSKEDDIIKLYKIYTSEEENKDWKKETYYEIVKKKKLVSDKGFSQDDINLIGEDNTLRKLCRWRTGCKEFEKCLSSILNGDVII